MDRGAYFADMVFGCQIDGSTATVDDFSAENVSIDQSHQFMDYSFGVLFNNEKVWFGLAAHHMTQPEMTYYEGGNNKLPIKLSARGGLKFDLSGGTSNQYLNQKINIRELTLAFNYKNQGQFQQLDMGAQITIQPFVMGVW